MRQAVWKKSFGIRRYFIGGSDARTIMGDDEAALIRLWQEKRGEIEPKDLSLTNARRGSANASRNGDREACANSPLSVLPVEQRDKSGEAGNDHRNPRGCDRRRELRLAHILGDF